MDASQEAALINGGDCFSHWHSEDRVPSQDFLHGLHAVSAQSPVSANATLTGSEDFILVDTSAGNVTVTLPRAINGTEVEIMKKYLANTLIILPQGSDTILLTTGVTIQSGGASLRFKAIGSDWRLI